MIRAHTPNWRFGRFFAAQSGKGTQTPISGHDVLGDKYGNDGVDGAVLALEPTTAADTGSQFIGFICDANPANIANPNVIARSWLDGSINQNRRPLPPFAHYLNGREISIVTGAAKGMSSRIVASGPIAGNRYLLRMEAFEGR